MIFGIGLGAIFVNQLVKWDDKLKEDLDKMLDHARAANKRDTSDLNKDLSQKLEAQTQRLELLTAQRMATENAGLSRPVDTHGCEMQQSLLMREMMMVTSSTPDCCSLQRAFLPPCNGAIIVEKALKHIMLRKLIIRFAPKEKSLDVSFSE